jgi:hypothetical protein
VSRADVSFRTKEAVVVFDPAQVSIEQMITAVQQAGFQPSVKRVPERRLPPQQHDRLTFPLGEGFRLSLS